MSAHINTGLNIFGLLGVVLLAVAPTAAEEDKWSKLFPDFPDAHTVALWLFDEPQYLHMTLTDASANMYDLRLLDAGRLVEGKFGRALHCSTQDGPAVASPYPGGTYDDTPLIVPDSRPVDAAEKLLDLSMRGTWTLEFWIKFDHLPESVATLVQLGRGSATTLELEMAARGRDFVLRGVGGINYLCPTDSTTLGNGQWHHVAFTGSENLVRHYLDGRAQSKATEAPPQPLPRRNPGLIGAIFASHDFTKPLNIRAAGQIDFYWGEPRDLSWAERWRARIQSPESGQIEFWCDPLQDGSPGVDPLNAGAVSKPGANEGVRLIIDGQTIIDGTESRRPGYGQFLMKGGRIYPVTLEFHQGGRSSRLRLMWRQPGREWELVPAVAFSRLDEDAKAALAEAGAAIEKRPFLTLGSGRFYDRPAGVTLDEMRFSDTVRYRADFTPPGTFSRNGGTNPPRRAAPNGPPLLFAADPGPKPVALGSRKHVFIDDVMIESRVNVHLKANPPEVKEETDMRNNKPWENPAPGAFGDSCVYDHDGEVRFVYPNGKMWDISRKPDDLHFVDMAVSQDGLHFEKPHFGHIEFTGSRDNNIILPLPVQGRVFKDTNPNVPPQERFKFSAFIMHRGVYLFVSPDGIHWRRNETIMLPFDCGGGVEMCWDDQRGAYFVFLRHEGWAVFQQPFGRAAAMGINDDIFRPWPFVPQPKPGLMGKAWSLPSFTHELPTPFEPATTWNTDPHVFIRTDHVYRTRAVKYEWAPDTYLAFVWRLNGAKPNEMRQTELATSRDGIHWTFYGEPYYFKSGWLMEGQKVLEALSVHGLIRRGDELWHYANMKCATHAESSPYDRLLRYVQRLDGFTALEAGEKAGWFVTRPFIFDGQRLELNLAVKGGLRVGILDGEGNAIPGFLPVECEPIRVNSVKHVVSWRGNSNVSKLAGKPVRLRIEMENAKLFAYQFCAP